MGVGLPHVFERNALADAFAFDNTRIPFVLKDEFFLGCCASTLPICRDDRSGSVFLAAFFAETILFLVEPTRNDYLTIGEELGGRQKQRRTV
jgi:hypothetical protein